MAWNTDTFNNRMKRKYGHNMNLTKFTNDELERIAKDVQREANRRFDSASRHTELQETKPYVNFAHRGRISLSKGFEWRGGKLVYNPNQTAQERRAYLQQEIKRGLDYTGAKSSSYTGYKDWEKNQMNAAMKAVTKYSSAKDAIQFKKAMNDIQFRREFWNLVRAFEEDDFARYQRGSDIVIDLAFDVMTQNQTQKDLVDEIRRMIDARTVNA